MFDEMIFKALVENEAVKQAAAVPAAAEVDRLLSHPNLDEAFARRARREADRIGAQHLGLPQRLRFLTVYDFFDDYLSVVFEVQDLNQEKNWCCYWWDHASVLHRVWAMWRKYENMRLDDPAGVDEEFLRIVVDHHMPILLSTSSPMAECDAGKMHRSSRRLASELREDSNDE